MSDRPTPEQLAESPNDIIRLAKRMLLADLADLGYVIVHPDDYPEMNLDFNEFGKMMTGIWPAKPGTGTHDPTTRETT